MKNKKERGVTLIALVVTIVVLLILAGVSISLVLNNNGVISKAKDAKSQYAEAQTNDEMRLNEVSDWIDTTVGETIEDAETEIEGVTIPAGYYYVGGTKAKGIVISDNVKDKELDKGKEDVRRDLKGNQWVWVPVKTISDICTTVQDEIEISGNTGVKTGKYTKSEIISGQKRVAPAGISYREPDILSDATNGDTDDKVKEAGFSSQINMAESIVNEYDEMIKSIDKYKGFYIGRYELTANGEKTGKTLTDTTWYTFYKNCKELAKGTHVRTGMIWGAQWDVTCNWLDSSGFKIDNTKEWGNHKNNTAEGAGKPQNTGYSESWKSNNIYDFAGNFGEWTQEALYKYHRVSRGGAYTVRGATPSTVGGINVTTATSKYNDYPEKGSSVEGTRASLYLVP